MKILSSSQIRQADAFTIGHEPIASIDLMERAADKCFDWIKNKFSKTITFNIICGLGNNGGDGLVIARLLYKAGYDVNVFILRYSEKCSEDFKINEDRLKKIKKKIFNNISDISELPEFNGNDVIIDAIFGSGLTKPVDGFLADVITKINKRKAFIISIDIPSGLFGENNSSVNIKNIVNADITLTFQVPKLSFVLPENYLCVGEWVLLDIGLDKTFIDTLESPYYFIEKNDIIQFLKPRSKYAHKGTFGHALLIAGSYGKMGAAILGSRACLKSGAGLITTFIPKIGYTVLQTAVPEAMVNTDETENIITSLPDISKYNAIAVGPGINTNEKTQNVIKLLIQNTTIPLIFDADAINILSENKTWLSFVPKNSIFTPHPKEFERLTEKPENDFHRLILQKEFSVKYSSYIIYKGAYSTISSPDGRFFFNPTGNPGMATAGSGDVLTGILLGLKSCGYSSLETCIIGTYIHGLAGDIARETNSEESLIAGDIVDNIGKAFLLTK